MAAGSVYSVTIHTVRQSEPARLPIIQRTALRTVRASEIESTKDIQAVKKAPTTTPARSRTRTSTRWSAVAATLSTRTIASRAPVKAAAGSAQENEAARPIARARTAPVAAPPEIPRM